MDPKDYDYLDVGTAALKGGDRSAWTWAGPLLVFAGCLACVGIIGLSLRAMLDRRAAAPAAATGRLGADDLVKRQLTAFVEAFLPTYYNFSYTLYDQSVSRAEAMMTPAFQAAYNQRAEDLDFKRKLISLRVNTDAIKILPGSMAFSNEGPLYYVRLAGTMTYTTGVNGASGDFPLTLLLAVQRTDAGFLVDNVERLR